MNKSIQMTQNTDTTNINEDVCDMNDASIMI